MNCNDLVRREIGDYRSHLWMLLHLNRVSRHPSVMLQLAAVLRVIPLPLILSTQVLVVVRGGLGVGRGRGRGGGSCLVGGRSRKGGLLILRNRGPRREWEIGFGRRRVCGSRKLVAFGSRRRRSVLVRSGQFGIVEIRIGKGLVIHRTK